MSSSYLEASHAQNFYSQHHLPNSTNDYHQQQYFSNAQVAFPVDVNIALYDSSEALSHALALFQQPGSNCMNSDQLWQPQPNIRIQTSTPTPFPSGGDCRHDSVVARAASGADGSHMYHASMGGPISGTQRPLKRARTHQRTPSASTVASTGPASPYAANTSYPQIANTDVSPNSPAYYADQAFFSKNLPTPQHTPTDSVFMNSAYIPSQSAHTPNAHLAMKGFAIDHHFDDFPPDFYQSSRQSMSSRGNNSPATPQSGAGGDNNYDGKNYSMTQNDYQQPNPNVQLFRTESSQAYQDELYNPPAYTSAPMSAAQRHSDYLSPHRNLVTERLQTANLARSASPTSAVSRERSPFRDGSPLAPNCEWKSGQIVGTAASMRQQQKEEAERAEYAQHRPQLQREPTKTISPKDAVLEYTDGEQPSLFQDSLPAGYRQHSGGTETWPNNFVSQTGSTFGTLADTGPSHHQMTPFRATASADEFNAANFSFMPLPPTQQDQPSQIQGTPFQTGSFQGPKMDYSDTTPQFPATLTSMESSVSEGGPPPSSQESHHYSAAPQRPSDTRANTGTYTCTYHGCTQRFDSHINLQKHKRDFHRSQQHKDSTPTTGTGSASPRSSDSPDPSTNGMTSAAILARNSQAGPHKCTRINPSTNKPCNTIFSRPYDLTRHEDTIHNNRKMKVRCPMCREEKTFSRNDALTRHMRVVHPEVETFGKRGHRGD